MDQISEQQMRETTANCITSTTPTYTRTTELRNVDDKDLYELNKILDESDYWRHLMEVIPKRLDAQASSASGALKYEEAITSGRKYSESDITLIKNALHRITRYQYYSQIMFEEWQTSGKSNERPTLGVLLQLLIHAELFRAADFVAEKLLNEPKPPRPKSGPAAAVKLEDFLMDIDTDAIALPSANELNENAGVDNTEEFNKDCHPKHMAVIDKNPMCTMKLDNMPPIPPPRSSRITRQTEKLSQLAINSAAAVHQNDERETLGSPGIQEEQQQQMQHSGDENSSTPSSHNIPLLSLLAKSLPVDSSMSNGSGPTGLETANDIQPSQTQPNRIKTEAPVPLVTLLLDNVTNDVTYSSSLSTIITNASSSSGSTIGMATGNGEETISQVSDNVNLPLISELNLLGERDRQDSVLMNGVDHSSINNDSDSLSNDDEDDENDEDAISLSNINNFDQRSSNNDSSLTNVTGTSGDNSFELTNDSNDSVSTT